MRMGSNCCVHTEHTVGHAETMRTITGTCSVVYTNEHACPERFVLMLTHMIIWLLACLHFLHDDTPDIVIQLLLLLAHAQSINIGFPEVQETCVSAFMTAYQATVLQQACC